MPSVAELHALSAEKMSKQTLTHILHHKVGLEYFSMKFSNGSISPKEGNYYRTPSKEVTIPDDPQISYITFKTYKYYGDEFKLYSVEMYSEKKENICTVMPEYESKRHHETHEVSLETAERIVAARIEVDKERRCYPCVI